MKTAINTTLLGVALAALTWAITTRTEGPEKAPVPIDPLEPVLNKFLEWQTDRANVEDQRLVAILDRLHDVTEAVDVLRQAPGIAGPIVEPPAEPAELCEPEFTVYLYTADSSWRCGPCENQKSALKAQRPKFAYTVIEVPSGGKSPNDRVPCWQIKFVGGQSIVKSGKHTTDVLNRWVRDKTEPKVAQVQGGYWTRDELRNWVKARYQHGQRLSADVSPRSAVWSHLQDYRHNFTLAQVSGLSQWEALCLHDAAHSGLIGPVR